jgi:hypothetical protein
MANDLIPTPNRIAQTLSDLAELIKNDALDQRQAVRTLMAAAANVKLLFELEADESGEFKLKNYGQAWMLADLLRNGDVVPASYKTDEQVVVGLMKAMEIGVSPISGLGNIMIINNRPSVWGDLAQALIQRTGALEKLETEELGERPDSTIALNQWPEDYGWRVTAWRKGMETPFVGEYRVRDARRAGMWGNTKKIPWITDPSRMIFNRARAFALRDGFADKLFGMGIIEEQQDFTVQGGDLRHEPAKLTSSLRDDEPETEAPGMRTYDETPPETPQEPQEAEGSEAPADAGEAPQQPENGPDGDESPQPSLV